MAESCATFPTLTSTSEITTRTQTTTTTTSVTTLPPTTTVSSTFGACSTTVPGAPVSCPPTLPITITIPGATQTVQVPITLPVDITTTTLVTLFGTSCTTINNPPANPSPLPPAPNSSSPSAPPPVIPTSQSVITTIQSNGSPTIMTVTETSTQPVNTIAVNDKDGNNTNVAPIIGGAVGGFFGLLAIVVLIWFILKRRRRWDDIFEKDDDEIIAAGARRAGRFSLDVDMEPKPYQYGLVGTAVAPSASSPPNSPPVRPSVPTGAADFRHARTTSLTPLNVTSMPMSTPLASSTTTSSRPSTGGSTHPLYSSSHQGYMPPLPPQPLSPVRPSLGSTNGSNAHSHSSSSVSFTAPPVSYANWNGSPGPNYNGGTSSAIMMGMTTSPSMPADEYSHVNRSGSPTSIQETQMRRLHVANAASLSTSPASDIFDMVDASSSSATAVTPSATSVVQRDGKGRIVSSMVSSPLVHVDGGRVPGSEPLASTVESMSSSGPSPPAYEA